MCLSKSCSHRLQLLVTRTPSKKAHKSPSFQRPRNKASTLAPLDPICPHLEVALEVVQGPLGAVPCVGCMGAAMAWPMLFGGREQAPLRIWEPSKTRPRPAKIGATPKEKGLQIRLGPKGAKGAQISSPCLKQTCPKSSSKTSPAPSPGPAHL